MATACTHILYTIEYITHKEKNMGMFISHVVLLLMIFIVRNERIQLYEVMAWRDMAWQT